MALLEAEATTSVFQVGNIKCKSFNIGTSSSSSPPKPLLIFSPVVAGEYPVIQFGHGFYLRNHFYSDLLSHIASHGYILVAPQIYEWKPTLGICEVQCAGEIADWIADKLQSVLPDNVEPKMDEFVIAGHSRGGKAAFAVALGYAKTKLKISALIGVDPVAGANKCIKTTPHILTGQAGSFNLTMPVLIIGTGLGSEGLTPCAPEGENHKEFYYESNPPRAHFVAKDYGHMDMLDDNLEGIVGAVANCVCKNGTGRRDCMRKTVGGLVVAFLKARLKRQREDLEAIVADPSLAPATLDPVSYEPVA